MNEKKICPVMSGGKTVRKCQKEACEWWALSGLGKSRCVLMELLRIATYSMK